MLDHAADEMQAHVAQPGITVAGEQRLAAIPDRHVGVHAGPVVGRDRLGHERGRLAIAVRHLMDDIFVDLHLVRRGHQRGKGKAQLMLRGAHLMMVLVHLEAHFHHRGDHLAANVDGAVHRRNGEVAALGARAVPHIADIIFPARIGRQFDIVDFIIAAVVTGFEPHIVEHEEFGFRADIDGVAHAAVFHEGFGALGGGTRIACIKLAARRLHDVAEQDHHGRGGEGIHIDRVQIGTQDHVALVDRLPALDGAAIEHQAVFEFILTQHFGAHGEMLPFALRIGKAKINPFDLLILDTFQDVLSGGGHVRLPFVGGCFAQYPYRKSRVPANLFCSAA